MLCSDDRCRCVGGLRELGKALGLGLGVQITGPAALAEVERLTAERDALAAQVARVEEGPRSLAHRGRGERRLRRANR
jgi:hypothetical protein